MIAGRKLLLADDSVAIQKVIDLTFTDEGMEVTTVGDGQDALQKLDQFTPDVVLADVYMPGVDGYELCKFIKEDERFRGVPVMLLVGSFEPFDEAEAKRAGADDVVTKPFQSIRELVSRVGSLVGRENSPANQSSVLGINEAAEEPTVEEASEVPAADVSVIADDSEQQPVKVFVEAPVMETAETTAQEHACLPDIELQTADTKQLEPIDAAVAGDDDADTIEVEVVQAAIDDEGVLDLGDVDSCSAASADDEFELDIEVEPLATWSDAAVLDNQPAVEYLHETGSVIEVAQHASTEFLAAREIEAAAPANATAESMSQPSAENLSPEAIEAISRRVVEQLSDKVVREIAWEVVPELSEMLIKKQLNDRK